MEDKDRIFVVPHGDVEFRGTVADAAMCTFLGGLAVEDRFDTLKTYSAGIEVLGEDIDNLSAVDLLAKLEELDEAPRTPVKTTGRPLGGTPERPVASATGNPLQTATAELPPATVSPVPSEFEQHPSLEPHALKPKTTAVTGPATPPVASMAERERTVPEVPSRPEQLRPVSTAPIPVEVFYARAVAPTLEIPLAATAPVAPVEMVQPEPAVSLDQPSSMPELLWRAVTENPLRPDAQLPPDTLLQLDDALPPDAPMWSDIELPVPSVEEIVASPDGYQDLELPPVVRPFAIPESTTVFETPRPAGELLIDDFMEDLRLHVETLEPAESAEVHILLEELIEFLQEIEIPVDMAVPTPAEIPSPSGNPEQGVVIDRAAPDEVLFEADMTAAILEAATVETPNPLPEALQPQVERLTEILTELSDYAGMDYPPERIDELLRAILITAAAVPREHDATAEDIDYANSTLGTHEGLNRLLAMTQQLADQTRRSQRILGQLVLLTALFRPFDGGSLQAA